MKNLNEMELNRISAGQMPMNFGEGMNKDTGHSQITIEEKPDGSVSVYGDWSDHNAKIIVEKRADGSACAHGGW